MYVNIYNNQYISCYVQSKTVFRPLSLAKMSRYLSDTKFYEINNIDKLENFHKL